MIEAAISLLILLAILVLFFFIIRLAVRYFEGPVILEQIIGLIFLLIFLIAALRAFGQGIPLWK